MNIVRISYEQGLVLLRSGGQWQIANTNTDQGYSLQSPTEVTSRFGLRPVQITESLSSGEERTFILAQKKPELFGLHVTNIQQVALRTDVMFPSITTLLYLLGALEYHCSRLCAEYARTCDTLYRHPFGDEDKFIFGGQGNCYFEFESLVTTMRRTYDALRFPLWRLFGPNKGSIPLSFYKTLPQCQSLPADVARQLTENWRSIGSRITEYRDCIQHYAPVAFSMGSLHILRGPAGAWTMRALIPDNPEARSQKRFTFRENLDALTFGWDAINSLLDMCTLVVDSVRARNAAKVTK
jgi:hypothetical protein